MKSSGFFRAENCSVVLSEDEAYFIIVFPHFCGWYSGVNRSEAAVLSSCAERASWHQHDLEGCLTVMLVDGGEVAHAQVSAFVYTQAHSPQRDVGFLVPRTRHRRIPAEKVWGS
ncbi:hypothetical protein PoB_007538000 [Plakobranchus ocellatus]|uniref:Uncharacterized protein n=1 Tax=Plakobranchus ocellatus TaxID=259542 RepID=A0AAV4DXZ5_9GAST|nr:hypothetical protein PoB_007538000 [Plakobranchus ocellatus]